MFRHTTYRHGFNMSDEFIRLKCPECQKRLKIPRRKAARKIKCPKCDLVFRCSMVHPPGSVDPIAAVDSPPDSNIIEAENESDIPNEYGHVDSMTQSSPGLPQTPGQAEQEKRYQEITPFGHTEDARHAGSNLEDWLNESNPSSLEVVEATLVEPPTSTKNARKRKPHKQSNRDSQTDPLQTRRPITNSFLSTPNKPTPQDLGGCIVACKRYPTMEGRVSKTSGETVAILSIVLFSILCAFVAGLVTLQLLGIHQNFLTATVTQKAMVVAIYGGYFAASLVFIFYLIRRSNDRMHNVTVEARQLGIRIQKNGKDILIPYKRLQRVYLEGQSDLAGLLTSLLVNRNSRSNNVLVFETLRGRKIIIKGCERIFTMPSLTAAINEINSKTGPISATPN